jgi:hypothetical protein
MPTTLRSFPQQNRSGTQQTPYAQMPAGIDYIRLAGVASVATLTDTVNKIAFVVLTSPTGVDADSHEIQREYWQGGTHINKQTHVSEPNPIDITFNLQVPDRQRFLALRASFISSVDGTDRTINVGADLIGLP